MRFRVACNVLYSRTSFSQLFHSSFESLTYHPLISTCHAGKILKVLKSEPLPKPPKGKAKPVVQAVGSTVVELVSQKDKDVLLQVQEELGVG